MEYLGSSTKHADIILDMENRSCHVLTYNYDVSMFGGFLSLSLRFQIPNKRNRNPLVI